MQYYNGSVQSCGIIQSHCTVNMHVARNKLHGFILISSIHYYNMHNGVMSSNALVSILNIPLKFPLIVKLAHCFDM